MLNYIREINAFYSWLQTNELSTSAISLWFALMAIDNRAEWKEKFSVKISTLMSMTSLSRRQVYRARDELYLADRVNFWDRSGRQSSVYMILPFGFTR